MHGPLPKNKPLFSLLQSAVPLLLSSDESRQMDPLSPVTSLLVSWLCCPGNALPRASPKLSTCTGLTVTHPCWDLASCGKRSLIHSQYNAIIQQPSRKPRASCHCRLPGLLSQPPAPLGLIIVESLGMWTQPFVTHPHVFFRTASSFFSSSHTHSVLGLPFSVFRSPTCLPAQFCNAYLNHLPAVLTQWLGFLSNYQIPYINFGHYYLIKVERLLRKYHLWVTVFCLGILLWRS